MKGRGVLALLLFFLLLVPHQRIESNPVLITKTLVWGSKLIRVSVPFTLNRLKSVYQSWKAQGRPVFSKLKIPLTTATVYIGASWLLNEFERIYQQETPDVLIEGNPPSPVVEVCSLNIPNFYTSCPSPSSPCDPNCTGIGCPITCYYAYTSYKLVWTASGFVVSGLNSQQFDCRSHSGFYNGSFSVRVKTQDGSIYSYILSGLFSSDFPFPPLCGSTLAFDLDSELSRILPNLLSSPVEAYPSADDPAYTDVFPIPAEAGDEVSITDTSTGQTQTETVTQDPDTGQTRTDQKTEQVALPEDNIYDPAVDVPQKQDIPSLIQTFIDSSPLMRWVQGANIQASPGACSVSGSWSFNGQSHPFTLDFCPLEPYLNTIGSFILAFAHLYALYIIFRIS